jgi:hypothetical protein
VNYDVNSIVNGEFLSGPDAGEPGGRGRAQSALRPVHLDAAAARVPARRALYVLTRRGWPAGPAAGLAAVSRPNDPAIG